jgi:hypothetical protein
MHRKPTLIYRYCTIDVRHRHKQSCWPTFHYPIAAYPCMSMKWQASMRREPHKYISMASWTFLYQDIHIGSEQRHNLIHDFLRYSRIIGGYFQTMVCYLTSGIHCDHGGVTVPKHTHWWSYCQHSKPSITRLHHGNFQRPPTYILLGRWAQSSKWRKLGLDGWDAILSHELWVNY